MKKGSLGLYIIFVVAAVFVWQLGVEVGGDLNYEKVLERVAGVKGVRYNMQIGMEGFDTDLDNASMELKCMVCDEGYYGEGTSPNWGGDFKQVISYRTGQMISIMDSLKKYMKIDFGDPAKPGMKNIYGFDPRIMFASIEGGTFTELGEKEIDGVKVKGVHYEDVKWPSYKKADATVWTDTTSGWPVRVELSGSLEGSELEMDMVLKDFEWDVRIDPKIYSPEIPADYTAIVEDIKMPVYDLDSAIEALEMYSKVVGEFPEDTNDYSLKYIEACSSKRAGDGYDKDGLSDRVSEIMKVMSFAGFVRSIKSDGIEFEYNGSKVAVGDGSAELMSWPLDDGSRQVVYGDLKVAVDN